MSEGPATPLLLGVIASAVLLLLAAAMVLPVWAAQFGDAACGTAPAANSAARTSYWPLGTRCAYQPKDRPPFSTVEVPWKPLQWLFPATLIGSALVLLLALAVTVLRLAERPKTSHYGTESDAR